MTNDLISRSALKEKTKTFIDCDGFNPVWQIIDEAPTVDAISNEESYEMYGKGYLQGYKRGKAEAIPQDKWIAVKDKLPDTIGEYLVSFENGRIGVADQRGITENHDFEPKMLAWQPLPEAYKEGGAE